jgi:DNA-binding IclR family transcriptional regulator
MSPAEQRELSSVGNALRLLEVLAGRRDAGVSELARELRVSKPTADRLLRTLVAAQFAEQHPVTRRYRLSSKIVALADGVRARLTVVEAARPHLVALADELHETIHLGALSGGSVVYLETVGAGEIFRIEVPPGTLLPAYATGVGKAVLAFSPPERISAYLDRFAPQAFTSSTVVDAAGLRSALAVIRDRGYAEDAGEILEEVRCVAVPIVDSSGYAAAAVSVSMPRSRFVTKRDLALARLLDAAARIAASTPDGAEHAAA